MFMPGMLGNVPAGSPVPTGGGADWRDQTDRAAGARRQGRRRGHIDRGHGIHRRAERVAAERREPRHIGLGRRTRRGARRLRFGAGTRSAPEPGSCIRACCDTSSVRGIIKSP